MRDDYGKNRFTIAVQPSYNVSVSTGWTNLGIAFLKKKMHASPLNVKCSTLVSKHLKINCATLF